jgi:hypothetical protein
MYFHRREPLLYIASGKWHITFCWHGGLLLYYAKQNKKLTAPTGHPPISKHHGTKLATAHNITSDSFRFLLFYLTVVYLYIGTKSTVYHGYLSRLDGNSKTCEPTINI